MSTHYMRSSVYGFTRPVAISPTRLSHEEEDPSHHILSDYQDHHHQQRFRPLRHERPLSSASSRSTTASKGITSRSLNILEKKAKQLLAQLSPSHGRATPTQHAQEDKRISRTLQNIRYGNYTPDYVPIDAPEPVVVPRTNRRQEVRSSVYSSHCLVSGNATRRSSRYFQI